MTSKVEDLVRQNMAAHDVRHIVDGYEVESQMAVSRLRFLPARGGDEQFHVVSIAEISTVFAPEHADLFDAQGIATLNAWSIHGTYFQEDGRLSMRAQYTIYEEEPAVELSARMILDAFAMQMPFGCSRILATYSGEQFRQQRAFQECPRVWKESLEFEAFESFAGLLRERDIVSTPDEGGIIAEVVLSGSCPSRMIEWDADTALLSVKTSIPHPLAGVGYLATIALPTNPPPEDISACCARLNALEMDQVDFVPRLGAWGVRGLGDELVYSQFIPTDVPIGHLHRTVMWWMMRRAIWLRDLGWEKEIGLFENQSSDKVAPL